MVSFGLIPYDTNGDSHYFLSCLAVVDDDPIEAEPEVEEPTVISTEWWAEYLKPDDEYNLEISGKLLLLAEILKMSESIGDKV